MADFSRIVVTGASGFLGGALARALVADGRPVLALGRDAAKLARLQSIGASTFSCDLSENGPPLSPALLEGAAIVHCAALSAPWGRWRDFLQANVVATDRLLAAAQTAGVKRFVHISSPSLYAGFRDRLGVREDEALPKPINYYAATKAMAEDSLRRATIAERIILRPRGLYGEGDTTLLPRLMAAVRGGPLPLLRDGRAVSDLTYVGDVVEAIKLALEAPNLPDCAAVNISGGIGLRLVEVIESAAKPLGLQVKWRRVPVALARRAALLIEAAHRLTPSYREPKITAYGVATLAYSQTLDISRAAAMLGYRPRVDFEQGLARTAASWR